MSKKTEAEVFYLVYYGKLELANVLSMIAEERQLCIQVIQIKL